MKFKRGQVTIFIIIAIVIVAVGFFLYIAFPSIKTSLGMEQQNPASFIQSCLEEEIKETADTVSMHGGDFDPVFYSTFNDIKIKNLCYTTLYCDLCRMQEPQLKPHIEREIKNHIETAVNDCFDSLQSSYEKRGYQATLEKGKMDVELLPKRITANINYSLTLAKTDTEQYDSFSVSVNNNLYELIAIANSILGYESALGNSEMTIYMTYYPDIKAERKLLSDGTKIYIITDRNTKDRFEFASRSLVLSPAGYC